MMGIMDTVKEKHENNGNRTLNKDILLYLGVFLIALLFNMSKFLVGEVDWYLRTDDLGPLMYPMAITGEKLQYFMQSFDHYYGYGYYWIFAPLFLLKQSREMILIEISVINAVFMSGVAAIISFYMHNKLKFENIVACICLPLLLTVFYGLNNNILNGGQYRTDNEVSIFFYVWFITFALLSAYMGESTFKKSIWNGIMIALILAWGTSLHERLLAVMAPTIFVICLLRFLGNKAINMLSFGITFIVGYFGQNIIKKMIKASFEMGSSVKNTSVVTTTRIWELESLDNFNDFFMVAWSNFSSLVLNTFGIATIGIMFFIIAAFTVVFLKKERKTIINIVKNHPAEFAGLFVFVTATVITVLGIGHEWGGNFVFKQNTKGLHYTRYFYSYCGPLIFFTMCILNSDKSEFTRIIKKISFFVMLAVALSDIRLLYPLEAKMSERYISHMYSFNFFNDHYYNLLISCVISLTVSAILMIDIEKKRITSMDVACAIIVIGLFANRFYLAEWQISSFKFDEDVILISESIDKVSEQVIDFDCYLDMDVTTGNRRKRNSIVFLTKNICFLTEKAKEIDLEGKVLVVSEREREDLLTYGCKRIELVGSELVIYTNSSQIYSVLTDGGRMNNGIKEELEG